MAQAEKDDWTLCFHSSGNEPGCAACWHGTAMRCEAENERLRSAIRRHRDMRGVGTFHDQVLWNALGDRGSNG